MTKGLEDKAWDLFRRGVTEVVKVLNASDLTETRDRPDYRNLPPAEKLGILKEMGFNPISYPHTHECPRNISSGYNCNCVPDPTLWYPPDDVEAYSHETWEERRERSLARDHRRGV